MQGSSANSISISRLSDQVAQQDAGPERVCKYCPHGEGVGRAPWAAFSRAPEPEFIVYAEK